MTSPFPFSGHRFEYQGDHIFFLQKESFGRIQTDEPRPVYVIGPRGTGKTTLLKALDLNERRHNKSLRSHLGDDYFASPSGPFIGVYLKLPEIQLKLVEDWGTGQTETEVANVIALYLDLHWLEQVTSVIAGLLAEGILVANISDERAAIARVIDNSPRTFASLGSTPVTLAQLRTALRSVRTEIEAAARARADWSSVVEKLDAVQQPGNFGRHVGSELAALCQRPKRAENWHFRICLDEGEVLSDLQQKALNSIVRLCKWPVFPVVAFGGLRRELTTTILPNLSLQDADRELLDLSEFMNARRFKELAEGVASARMTQFTGEPTRVDLQHTLGSMGVNELLEAILQESVSPLAKELLATARQLKDESQLAGTPSRLGRDTSTELDADEWDAEDPDDAGSALPIYQAYLMLRLGTRPPQPGVVSWKKRKQESAETRKRMVAAYLSICNELNTEVRYASARVVLRLCDLCIRDFLKFLNSLHRVSGLPPVAFVNTPMNWRLQHEAIKEASLAKSQSVRNQDVRAPRETQRVVNGLARLTRLLQVSGPSGSHLRSSERGKFILPVDKWRDPTDRVGGFLRDACNVGFLTFLKEDDATVTIRVHTSLAPAFQFSYRGAYYDAPITWNDIQVLSITQKEDEIPGMVDRISQRILGAENLSLFPDA